MKAQILPTDVHDQLADVSATHKILLTSSWHLTLTPKFHIFFIFSHALEEALGKVWGSFLIWGNFSGPWILEETFISRIAIELLILTLIQGVKGKVESNFIK